MPQPSRSTTNPIIDARTTIAPERSHTGRGRRHASRGHARGQRRIGLADPATLLGDARHRARPHARCARQRDRQRRAAHHRAKSARERSRLDLDRQRLPARHHHFAAAARLARRPHRLSAHLSGRADAVYDRVARLRVVHLAADARARSRGSGLRRGGHHEREHRARAHDLSAHAARARHRDQRDGGGGVVGGRADGRLRRARRRCVAVAVRDQRADRHRGDRRRLQGFAVESRP